MPNRDYSGNPLDMTWQDLKDRPYKGDGETVDVSDSKDAGEMKTIGTPEIFEKEDARERAVDLIPHMEELSNDELADLFENSEECSIELAAFIVILDRLGVKEDAPYFMDNVWDGSVGMFKSFLEK